MVNDEVLDPRSAAIKIYDYGHCVLSDLDASSFSHEVDQRSAISDQRSAISDQRQMLNDLRKDSCKRASGGDCEEIARSILICTEMQEEENLSYERISLDVG